MTGIQIGPRQFELPPNMPVSDSAGRPEADVLHIAFGRQGVRSDSSAEVAAGVFVEFDSNGNPIGIEVISVPQEWRNCASASSRQVALARLYRRPNSRSMSARSSAM